MIYVYTACTVQVCSHCVNTNVPSFHKITYTEVSEHIQNMGYCVMIVIRLDLYFVYNFIIWVLFTSNNCVINNPNFKLYN